MRFRSALAFVFVVTAAFTQERGRAADVNFITTDIDRFWIAFDEFKKDTTQNPFEAYVKNGTEALNFFLASYYDSLPARAMKKMVKAEMAYFEKFRPFAYRMNDFKAEVSRYFQSFQSLYANAEFPPVYFVIGRMNCGGTATRQGIVIGMERFCDSTFTTSKGLRALDINLLPVTIATCLVFYNQKPAHTGYTLLRESIVAGSADFLCGLIVGEKKQLILRRDHYRYGDAHEENLVKEFLRRKDDQDMSGWFYYGNTGGRANDLAYWIGYRITEAYYDNAHNKLRAIDEILKINDFDKFLLLSGYAEPFRD
jgi:hypothetical protein